MRTISSRLSALLLAMMLGVSGFGLMGCEEKDAGDHMEDAADDLGDAAEETGENMEDAMN